MDNEVMELNDMNEVSTCIPSINSSDDYIIELESRLIGQGVEDEAEAYRLYCDYAHAKGFSVRKGKEYKFGSGVLRWKLFLCFREGVKDVKQKIKGNGSRSRLDERTGCGAKIMFARRNKEDRLLRVVEFVKDHNYEMTTPQHRHLLRSARMINGASARLIESHVNAGLRIVDSFSLAVENNGGAENVGYVLKDAYNYVNRVKRSKINAGDCQTLVIHFKTKENEEGLFYWDVQLDNEGRVYNAFWRDERFRIDYEYYGDVVSFDTTYRTNRYHLACAPFIGMNNHGQNVIFGCGLLLEENSECFEWLFNTFLESMGGKQPQTLFTDQDSAMMKAISKVLPNVHHRLCTWHISKNAPSHIGDLNSSKCFWALFRKCMSYCFSEEEFEDTWGKIMTDLDGDKISWLNMMYGLRERWSSAFNLNVFCGDWKTTSRSESKNRAINRLVDRSTTLFEFFTEYEKMVKGWHREEGIEDEHNHRGIPTPIIGSSKILQHAAKVYTRNAYKWFEDEFKKGVGAADTCHQVMCNNNLSRFEVVLHENKRVGVVEFDSHSLNIECSCKLFTTKGILCSHALRILSFNNVHGIPEKYILKRWTRDVKKSNQMTLLDSSSRGNQVETEMIYTNRMMRLAFNIVSQSKLYMPTRLLFEQALAKLAAGVSNYIEKNTENAQSLERQLGENLVTSETHVLDPLYVKPRGISKARIRNHWETQKKRSPTKRKFS